MKKTTMYDRSTTNRQISEDQHPAQQDNSSKVCLQHTSPEMKAWKGKFGQEYTWRNLITVQEKEAIFQKHFGLTRSALNYEFLGQVDRSAKILEVGCNTGAQLLILQSMGFTNLYGLELQSLALDLARKRTHDVTFVQGSALELPFANRSFDLVFTSGVLIHINPQAIEKAIKEIQRCTRKFIWGYEYFSNHYQEITYRGEKGLLWKTDFVKLYRQICPNLKLLKETRLKYQKQDLTDTMFLLLKD